MSLYSVFGGMQAIIVVPGYDVIVTFPWQAQQK